MTADGAGMDIQAVFGTSCRGSHRFKCMHAAFGFIADINFAAIGAGKGSISVFGASGRRYNLTVVVRCGHLIVIADVQIVDFYRARADRAVDI